jgi:hypothetical protein
MKKNIAILLLLLFSFDIIGYFFVFAIQNWAIRNSIKQQIKQEIPLKNLVLITVDEHKKSEIKWKEDGEFRYHGEMYDVVRSKTRGDGTILYYCIADKAETQLFKQLEQYIGNRINNQENSSKGKTYLIKLFTTIFSLKSNLFRIILLPLDIPLYDKINLYESRLIDVDLPPPKTILSFH